ncbi:Kae1-associated kinase Bud32 [Candidatus Woesearchaeota archaeon CG10_big_fil_rev_8_21_14_0_10_34_8]|nr:MAG: Kae1-associated kinase Bud32 [Candidatus Woesearchaeota archaeon CG10_big_fil_rev_8_21_14_0_10_34_8]
MKTIAQGAEATLYLDKNKVIKKRLKKSYRIKELDDRLRTSRTKREAKVLIKIHNLNFTPKLLSIDETDLEIEHIEGAKLACCLEQRDYKKIGAIIGKQVRLLHDNGIIHGDLTTSNMILTNKNKEVYFIDFGLSFFSEKIEDKAVDLHLLEEALESKHHTISKIVFNEVKKKYDDSIVLNRLEQVESRGRNKHK